MKKILCILGMLSYALAQPEGFVHPSSYDETDQQYQKVLEYIEQYNINQYCNTDDSICHPNVLRAAESDNISAFLSLSTVQNQEYLNRLIEEYCNTDFFQCGYANLLKLYEEKLWCDVGIWEMRDEQNINFKNRQYPK
ncbi:hypothetical protein [Wohlfahrtiimonas larvae]|uniref:Uncharacterized protein n=1 Tax=Wohlfahrtiimonas larvae TaxID=1157986 RepID=A0ABP9MRP2_9GAMM|nr:hypothetical protein [Wohlfahrtiimonas larvae]